MKKKFLLCLALSLCIIIISDSKSQASINTKTVNRAWEKMSAAAGGLDDVGIIIDKNNKPNSYVKFKSNKDFTVHINTGLMRILKNEEQAAGVFGHEIGHIKLGHYDRNIERQVGWSVVGALLSRAHWGAQIAGNLGMNLAEKGFSRGQEVEADDYAVKLLAKAGYNPDALYQAMNALAKNNFITKENGFSSHPPTSRRLKHLQDEAKKLDMK